MANEDLSQRSAQDVLRETERNSYGVVRIYASSAGTPGEEREYQAGDEALVEAGQAEWVVGPVHLPAAGRRLDADAEREATPADGVEAYPPAEPTVAARRVKARTEGVVEADSDSGLAERLTARRAEVAREADDGVARQQAELGSRSARSGPITAQSDLSADQSVDEQPKGRTAKSTKE